MPLSCFKLQQCLHGNNHEGKEGRPGGVGGGGGGGGVCVALSHYILLSGLQGLAAERPGKDSIQAEGCTQSLPPMATSCHRQ